MLESDKQVPESTGKSPSTIRQSQGKSKHDQKPHLIPTRQILKHPGNNQCGQATDYPSSCVLLVRCELVWLVWKRTPTSPDTKVWIPKPSAGPLLNIILLQKQAPGNAAALFLEPTGAENLNAVHATDSHLALKTMLRVGGLALLPSKHKTLGQCSAQHKGKIQTHNKKQTNYGIVWF